MASYFKTSFGPSCVSVPIPQVDSDNDIIICVDKSGSMAGSAMNKINDSLKQIYTQTKKDYDVYCYDNVLTKRKLKDIVENNKPISAGGGTVFASLFDGLRDYIIENQKGLTAVFLTDGQNNGNITQLNSSVEMLKLTISGIEAPITFNVIGFTGAVNNVFLEEVRKYGNKEGVFKYSENSAELQNDFNEIFEYSLSSREVTVRIAGKEYVTNGNDDSIQILVDDDIEVDSLDVETDKGVVTHPLVQNMNVKPIDSIKALNLRSPKKEEDVRSILHDLHSIMPSGSNVMERLEVEQIKKEINSRMMEYINLFSKIKSGKIPNEIKLKLNALRHEAKFGDMNRKKKLDLRVNRNMEYFQKTDIKGILQGYKKDRTVEQWDQIKAIQDDWICIYSMNNLYNVMRSNYDDFLCVGILVERDESAIDSPTKGLKLVSMSNTIMTYSSFIHNLELSKKQKMGEDYDKFEDIDDAYCLVGQTQEKINAVIPLYLHSEHMKIIRIMEGLWLGHLFTLDSYGYDKAQEVGFIKLLHELIKQKTGVERNSNIIREIEKVCEFIVSESVGFKSAFGENTYENFKKDIHYRTLSVVDDLTIPMMVGYLTNDLKNSVVPLYYQFIYKHIKDKYKGKSSGDVQKYLLHGAGNMVIAKKEKPVIAHDKHDPDYVEQSYVNFFHDDAVAPLLLIPEVDKTEDRKPIIETDVEYIKTLIPPVPNFITDMMTHDGIENPKEYIEHNIDYDLIRKELLMALAYDNISNVVTYNNVLGLVDDKIQGKLTDVISYEWTSEHKTIVINKALNCKTLEGFAGILLKYAPNRQGAIINSISDRLLSGYDIKHNPIPMEKRRNMLIALLSNKVGYAPFYKDISTQWMPIYDIMKLKSILTDEDMATYGPDLSTTRVQHRYRDSDIPNRHGYCNSNPNPNFTSAYGDVICPNAGVCNCREGKMY